jgi:hypothetical protein
MIEVSCTGTRLREDETPKREYSFGINIDGQQVGEIEWSSFSQLRERFISFSSMFGNKFPTRGFLGMQDFTADEKNVEQRKELLVAFFNALVNPSDAESAHLLQQNAELLRTAELHTALAVTEQPKCIAALLTASDRRLEKLKQLVPDAITSPEAAAILEAYQLLVAQAHHQCEQQQSSALQSFYAKHDPDKTVEDIRNLLVEYSFNDINKGLDAKYGEGLSAETFAAAFAAGLVFKTERKLQFELKNKLWGQGDTDILGPGQRPW